MELTDSRDIKASPREVWEAITDARVLKDCIPGCQELTGSPEEGFKAVVTQKVGPVKATFKGQVTMTDIVPGGTRLSYDVEAKVGGKLAQLGSRLIDGFAKKMADQFFDRFKARVEGGGAEATDAATPPEPEAAAAGEDASEKKGWLNRLRG